MVCQGDKCWKHCMNTVFTAARWAERTTPVALAIKDHPAAEFSGGKCHDSGFMLSVETSTF